MNTEFFAASGILQAPLVQAIFDNMAEGILVFDPAGALKHHNRAAEALGLTGHERRTFTKGMFQLDGRTPLGEGADPLRRILAGERIRQQEVWWMPKGSPVRILLLNGYPISGSDRSISGALLVVHDITQRIWAEKRLEVSEQRYKSLFDNHPDMVYWMDLDGMLLSVNGMVRKIAGYTEEDLKDRHFVSLAAGGEGPKAGRRLKQALKGRPQSFEMKGVHRNGSLLDFHVTIIPIFVNERITGLYAIAQDIGKRKQNERIIQELAFLDPLTQLPNRRSFHEGLEQAVARAGRKGETLSVLFLDLDRFKYINDTVGHSIGDQVLQGVSLRLKESLRKNDRLFRLGGDEFTVLLPRVNRVQTDRIVRDMLKRLSMPLEIGGRELQLNSSIGISMFPIDGEDAETLIKHADAAMYRAKEAGHPRYRFYAPEMIESINRKMQLEQELSRALGEVRISAGEDGGELVGAPISG